MTSLKINVYYNGKLSLLHTLNRLNVITAVIEVIVLGGLYRRNIVVPRQLLDS